MKRWEKTAWMKIEAERTWEKGIRKTNLIIFCRSRKNWKLGLFHYVNKKIVEKRNRVMKFQLRVYFYVIWSRTNDAGILDIRNQQSWMGIAVIHQKSMKTSASENSAKRTPRLSNIFFVEGSCWFSSYWQFWLSILLFSLEFRSSHADD